MSWKVEVETPAEVWSSNSVRFATKEEAAASGNELLSRWTVPISSRPAETPTDPVNAKFNFERGCVEMILTKPSEA